jgi:hypothetical protein
MANRLVKNKQQLLDWLIADLFLSYRHKAVMIRCVADFGFFGFSLEPLRG